MKIGSFLEFFIKLTLIPMRFFFLRGVGAVIVDIFTFMICFVLFVIKYVPFKKYEHSSLEVLQH